ncbi:MAG: sensor histidine kinase [Chitinophagales bacterium]|nr:sensor histidine kinase [Chitinophagales bacterium]
MKTRITLLFFLSCFFTTAFCNDLDSLLHILKTAKEDTNKVKLLLAIEDVYAATNIDSSFYYTQQCFLLIKKIKATDFIYSCNLSFAEYYYNKYDFENSIKYCLENIEIVKKKNDLFLLAKSYSNIATIYTRFGRYKLATEYGILSLKLTEKINDTSNMSIRYANLSRLYSDLRQYDKAIYYGKKGITAGEKYKNTKGLLLSLNNTGMSYSQLYQIDKAISIHEKQYSIAKQNDKTTSIISSLVNLIMNEYQNGKTKEINQHITELNKTISIYNNPSDKTIAVYQKITSALFYLINYDYQKCEEQIINGISIADLDGNADGIMTLYEIYSKLKYAQHDFVKGEYLFYKYDSIKENVFSKELSEFSLDLETKYETQKKENEILKQQQQLKKRNNWIVFLLSSIAVLSLLSFLFYRYFKQQNTILEKEKIIQQQKITDLEKEKQLQATESILKGQEEERNRIAKDLHDGLGGLLSGVKYSLNNMKENVILSSENALSFERTVDMLDSGIQELRRVAHNMMPENLIKFGLDTALKDYCTSISNTGKLNINYSSFGMDNFKAETNVSITVYRVIQELINNTMKHANATESIVQLVNENNILHITVEDNGKGFDVKNINNFKGAGWTNIQNRITYLKGKINVDSSEQNGTSITIEIPIT